MATIVGGAVGAAIGFYTGGPAGARLGWSIGTTVGALVDSMAQPGIHVESGKLADLKVSGSAYGTVIPQVWGAVRCAGNVIWSTDLQEHSHTQHQGGGSGTGGGASSKTYTYTVSFAAAFCRGTTMLADGTLVKRNVALKRLWLDDMIVWDSSLDNNAVDVAWYDGDELQPVDPFMQAANNSLSTPQKTPAYRGMCYVLVKDLDTTNFSNRIPNVSAELSTDPVTVSDICGDIAGQAGLRLADMDLSQATTAVTGYQQTARVSAQDALAPVLSTYLYDLVETDGVLRPVMRGGASILTIDPRDLGAMIDDGSAGAPPSRVEQKRTQDTDLPGRVDITYFSADPNRHFEQFTQGDDRQASGVRNAVALTLPLTLTEVDARLIAARQMDTAWVERETFIFSLPPRYVGICCADPILLPLGDPAAPTYQRVRLTSQEMGLFGELRCEAVADDLSVLTQTLPGGANANGDNAVSLAIVPTDFTVWSGTELRNEDQLSPGFYVAATAAAGWQGAALYYSADGTMWTPCGRVTSRAVWGHAASALPASTDAVDWDTTSTIGVDTELGGLLESSTDAAVLTGQNAAVIGNEIIGFTTATLTGAGQYTLSRLRRGFRGSPMTGHAAGEQFVLADDALVRVSVPASYAGLALQVKAVSSYQMLGDVVAQAVTIAPRTPTAVEVQGDANAAAIAGLQNQIDNLPPPPITPFWRVRGFTKSGFGDNQEIDASYFTGANLPAGAQVTAWTQYAAGPGGSFVFETYGLSMTIWARIKVRNTTGAAITGNFWVPRVDDGAKIVQDGTTIADYLAPDGSGADNKFAAVTVAAGATSLLELFLYNQDTTAANPGHLTVITDLLDQAGLAFVDAGA